jgi:hypothetical protein
MDEEGEKLEALIGLSSQICKLIRVNFDQELENGQNKEMFGKMLVDSLNANMNLVVHCPGTRRVIIE